MARPRRTTAAAAALCAAASLAGCSGSAPAPSPTAALASPRATGSPQPAPSVGTPAPPGLASCPTVPAAAAGLPVLWRGGQPDDLAVAPDGALWISDETDQVVRRIVGGTATRTLRGLAAPEGVVPLPDGDVVVAEQGRQRITAVHPDGSLTVLLTLPPAGNQLGVDGIGYDPRSERLLVPDSPHGTLLSLSPDRPGAAVTLATGLGRVVGVEPGTGGTGTWLAAEAEAPRGLLHLDAGAAPVGRLAQLDDVVLLGGLLYVTDLRGRSVHAVAPQTGADRTVADGFLEPQGLAALPDGTLAVADARGGVVRRITPCGG
jgi:hypothetical protein